MPSSSPELTYAERMNHMGGSAIREMLKVAGQPGFISLGGGLPSPDSFPLAAISKLRGRTEAKYGTRILQYGTTEGFPALIEALPEFLARPNRQVIATPETLLVTAGSQEALFILGCMFIDPGAKIAVESPTYLGALQAFNTFGPKYVEVPTDKDGIIPGGLEEVFRTHPDLRFLYTIPSFQNPSGSCMNIERREAVADLLRQYKKFAVEDDPYSELRYDGQHLPSLQSLVPQNVVHLFSFSKTLAPDYRVGGMVAPKDVRDRAVITKQGNTLFTSQQNQAVVAEYLSSHAIDTHLPEIIAVYQPRRNAMVDAIEEYFPSVFETNCPQGGMFLWSKLKEEAIVPKDFNLNDVLMEAVSQKVGFVTGAPFYAYPDTAPLSMRLNFTNQTEDNIRKGIGIIGSILHRKLG